LSHALVKNLKAIGAVGSYIKNAERMVPLIKVHPKHYEQDRHYTYPYHYLPETGDHCFRQHRHWSWGYRYLGRLKVAFDLIKDLEFESLLDIGCGSGRFLREAQNRFGSAKRFKGIDISEKAIHLAKLLNPGLEFEIGDIIKMPTRSLWDVVTLLDVIEHIPPAILPEFIDVVCSVLRPGGVVVVTVPHVNEPLIKKHYQHFDITGIKHLFSNTFQTTHCFLFDHMTLIMKLFYKLMGGSGRYFIISHQGLNKRMFDYYMEHCLYGTHKKQGRRLAFMAWKKT
jgi:2-polyprenyl-3-methyl-5-hydroxy-6-metoxy-1,4-benzoquinol methylase